MSDNGIGVLQAIRLKGRPTGTDVASATGATLSSVTASLRALVDAEQCAEVKGRYRLTPAGRDRLRALITAERACVDARAVDVAYRRFDPHNAVFKKIVTDWQLKDGVVPNDHTDVDYDTKVLDRLVALHEQFQPLLEKLVRLAPRLAPYPVRFAAALAKIRGGDHSWLSRPMIDSYHTVWFELHEDLIGLAGRRRLDEAVSGRAE